MRTRYAGAQNKKCGGKGLSMSNQLKENGATMLERWKALVKIERLSSHFVCPSPCIPGVVGLESEK